MRSILTKIFRFLIGMSILCTIIFIIKWNFDSLYNKNITPDAKNFTISDEFKKIHNQFKVLINKDNKKESPQLNKTNEPKLINIIITEPTSVEEISKILLKYNLIKDEPTFVNLVDSMGLTNKFVSGAYKFKKNEDIKNVIYKLTNTKEQEFEITIPNGFTSKEVGELLKERDIIISAEAFDQQCTSLGLQDSIVPGNYKIKTPTKIIKLIEKITKK